MSILLYILLVLLGLKLTYNLAVPYQLLWKQDEKAGVSIMVAVEWLLLVLALVVSIIARPETDILKFWSLLIIGAGAIITSYFHFALVMMIGGWLISRKH